MQSNIYAQKENGDLRLVAEIEGESDPALAVDALLDEMPRLKQRSFIVIDLDNVMVVEAEDEIVQPRRKITVSGSNSTGAVVSEPEADEDDEAGEDENGEDEQPEAEEEAPKPTRRRRPAAKPAAKSTPRKSGRKAASGRKSPFKANPASAE